MSDAMNPELLKGLLKLAPHLVGGLAPPKHRVEIRVEIEPGPEADKIRRAARVLSERTRLPNGIETLKLARPGAADEFMEVCRTTGIDVDEIKARLGDATLKRSTLPVEQIVQLTRALTKRAGK